MSAGELTAAPLPGSRRRRSKILAGLRQDALPWLLVAPVLVLVGIGVLYPLIYIGYLSTQDYSPYLGKAAQSVGLTNYGRVLSDPLFWGALGASVVWVVGSVVPQFLLGLGMALLLNERFRGRAALRTIVLAPWAVSGVATGLIWLWLFDGTIGVVNDMLVRAGILDAPVAWTVDTVSAWVMVFVANAWRGAPFFAIVILAALQSISPSLYEAADIDGATPWDKFLGITLPLIANAIVISTLLRALWTFNFIDLLWTMTQGGPAGATTTLPIFIFDVIYQKGDFGYGAALSVVLCLILITFSAAYWQLNRLAGR